MTTTTVTTTKTVKEQPKKVASNHHARPDAKPAPKKEISHRKKHDNRRRHVVKHKPKHGIPKHACKPAPVAKKKPPKPAVKPAPVCHTTVVKTVEVAKPAKPVTVEIDGKSLAAGAIIGGILALTAVAAAN